MADATPSRLGQENATGSDTAIFLETFSGLVLEAFDTEQISMDKHLVRTVKNTKSSQFPLVWKATASYHTPGVELSGQLIKGNQKTITIEDLLVADVFVDVLDDAMNHYDIKSMYAHQLAEALANTFDTNVFRALFVGAAASHPIDTTGDNDGTALSTANMSTVAAELKGAIFDAAQTLDEKRIPSKDRFAVLLPLAWYLMLEDGEFLDRDFAGEGSKARATMPFAADLAVYKSNNIPIANDTSNTDVPTALRDDFRECIGLVWHKTGAGTVKLLDLQTETGYDIRRQGDLLVAKYAIGQDYLRTEACISLEDQAIV